ncbi:MAG: CcmD family protein [Bacteroidota bacterium]|nr:CcmD family protein [Candidatus Kapabacteria bacterium]MDW8219547.1 CcmD family protein [Bacteroidota bacterium]
MYEFLTQHSLYVVLIIALTVWLGIAYYLMRLERIVTKYEQSSSHSTNPPPE